VPKTTNMTMRLFFTAALIGCGAFHVAFGQNTCETFTDHIGFQHHRHGNGAHIDP